MVGRRMVGKGERERDRERERERLRPRRTKTSEHYKTIKVRWPSVIPCLLTA